MKLARNLLITGTVLCVSTLAATNIHTYRDNIKLQKGIHHEQGVNLDLKDKLYKQIRLSNEQGGEIEKLNHSIKNQSSKIHTLEKQLENASKDSESPMHRTLKMEITAYTAGVESTGKTKGDNGYGITTSGTHVQEGRTISCPPSFKFGTKIKIKDVGIRVCEDRGDAIKEGDIDLYISSLHRAQEFGRKILSVEVLNKGGK